MPEGIIILNNLVESVRCVVYIRQHSSDVNHVARLSVKLLKLSTNRNIDLTYPSDDIRYSCEYSIVLESSGASCLYGRIHMSTEDTRMRVGDENTRKVYASYPNLSDDLLGEFDFEGSVCFSDMIF